MKTNEDIDKLFREGTQKNYPYDENLWAQVESELPNGGENLTEKSQWKNSLKLLLILAFILFLETDTIVSFNQYVPRQSNTLKDISSSDEKLALLTKKSIAPKSEQNEIIKKDSRITNSRSTQKQEKQTTSTISAMSEEKHKAETNNHSTKSNAIQQKPSNSVEPDEDHIYTPVEENNFKLEANVDQSLQDYKPSVRAEMALPSTGKLSKLSSLGFQIESNYSTPLAHGVEKNKLNEMQQKFKKRDYFIEFELGRSVLINKQLSGLEANVDEYRKEAEKSKFQQSIGLNLLTNVNKFTVGVGFHLSSFYEQINYSYNEEISRINVSYDTSYSVINGTFNSNGTPVILIRENINENRMEVTENVKRELIINNHFKRISLPVSLGYTKTFGRINVGLRSAIALNYLYASSGGYISKNRDQFYSFEEKEQLEDWVIGNRNQLRLGYSLNEFVVVGTSLNHEQDLSSFSQSYSSKFNTYGLGFWLLYRPR